MPYYLRIYKVKIDTIRIFHSKKFDKKSTGFTKNLLIIYIFPQWSLGQNEILFFCVIIIPLHNLWIISKMIKFQFSCQQKRNKHCELSRSKPLLHSYLKLNHKWAHFLRPKTLIKVHVVDNFLSLFIIDLTLKARAKMTALQEFSRPHIIVISIPYLIHTPDKNSNIYPCTSFKKFLALKYKVLWSAV